MRNKEQMIELGKREDILGADQLKQLQVSGRPATMPSLVQGHSVVCGYDQGLGERLIVCDNLTEMQQLYDNYAEGGAIRIKWYSGDDVDFIASVSPTSAVAEA